MAVACDLQTLLTNAKCYLDQCNSDVEREALQIYFRVQGLAAAGGTSYSTLTALLEAAKTWQSLSEKQISAIETYLSQSNAVTNGADTLSSNINTLKAAAACYICLPTMTRKQLLAFLNCALSNQNVAG